MWTWHMLFHTSLLCITGIKHRLAKKVMLMAFASGHLFWRKENGSRQIIKIKLFWMAEKMKETISRYNWDENFSILIIKTEHLTKSIIYLAFQILPCVTSRGVYCNFSFNFPNFKHENLKHCAVTDLIIRVFCPVIVK